ncbi:MAG: hemerythrin domain-containing protein, partial [Riemerella sp.]|nr:hemerythrin domain-containing protein [Riemerella sp.]
VPLSQDHHFGLLSGWKIKQGIKKNISYERIKNYINYHWDNSQSFHFDEEEKILFPYSDDELTQRALDEHKEIRELLKTLNEVEDFELLTLYADKVTEHIRFEERVLFPHLENILTEEQLAEVGKKLNEIHHHAEDEYDDEFWK